jgi:ATP-dependent Clp protease ATP-binding subunit ClpC
LYPFERFDDDAKRVLTLAQQEAEEARHSYIGTEHVLLALLRSGTRATRLLNALGVDQAAAREAIERTLGSTDRIVIQRMIPTSGVKKSIELAFETAERQTSELVTPVHLLLGLIEEGDGVAAHVLQDLGVTEAAIAGYREDG